MSSGYVYVLSNQSMPGVVKVGRSIHGGASRGKAFYQTGVPSPYLLEFEIYTKDHEWLESQAHMSLRFSRVNPDREFFRCQPGDAIEEILAIYSERLCSSAEARSEVQAIPEVVLSPEEEAEAKAKEELSHAKRKETLKRLLESFDC